MRQTKFSIIMMFEGESGIVAKVPVWVSQSSVEEWRVNED